MPTINGRACVVNGGANLIIQSDLKGGYIDRYGGGIVYNGGNDFYSDIYTATNGETVFTFSSPDHVFKGFIGHTLAMYDSDKNYLGWQSITSATQTLSKPNVAYIRFSINFVVDGGTVEKLSDWLSAHRYKLEKGSVATPWTPAPVDKVFSNGVQVYGRNYYSIAGLSKAYNDPTHGNITCVDIQLEPNTKYTISTDSPLREGVAKDVFAGTPTLIPNSYDNGVSKGEPISCNTDNTGVLTVAYRYLDIKNGMYHIKVERGTVATAWTPAPEDVM